MAHVKKYCRKDALFLSLFFKLEVLKIGLTTMTCLAYWIYAFCSIASMLKLPMQLPCDLSRCCHFLTTGNGGMNTLIS